MCGGTYLYQDTQQTKDLIMQVISGLHSDASKEDAYLLIVSIAIIIII
jgi:hypothetical protein